MEEQKNKSHHRSKVGSKAEKRKPAKGPGHQNAKAFTVSNVRRRQRDTQHMVDKAHRRHVAPVFNPEAKNALHTPPPVVVAFHGPKGVGKSLAIKCLVKRWTKQSVKLGDKNAPLTVVTGKNKRLTLIECPSDDLDACIDIAKVADLVLIFIDASKGLEMPTFEMLNILQTHGMTKVHGVLTHLDMLSSKTAVRVAKKQIKDRFWAETFPGNKMFYLSSLKHNRYLHAEVANLGRFITLAKFRPLTWRTSHSYVVVDRVEAGKEIGARENNTIVLFGYLRGKAMRQNMPMHISGLNDTSAVGFAPQSVEVMGDPCPLPQRLDSRFDGKPKQSRLKEKDKLLYAPMVDVGSVIYDKDAVYIDLPDQRRQFTAKSALHDTKSDSDSDDTASESEDKLTEGVQLVRELQQLEDTNTSSNGLSLFPDGDSVSETESAASDSDSESSNSDTESIDFKNDVGKEAMSRFNQRSDRVKSLSEQIYASESESELEQGDSDTEGSDTDFFHPYSTEAKKKDPNTELVTIFGEETSVHIVSEERFGHMRDWQDRSLCEVIRNRFVTGDWKSMETPEEEDFEDLEAEEQPEEDAEVELSAEEMLLKAKAEKKARFNLEYDQSKQVSSVEDKPEEEEAVDLDDEHLKQQKAKADAQHGLGKTEFLDMDDTQRTEIEGVRPGSYIRLVFSLSELHLDSSTLSASLDRLRRPLTLGGVNIGEQGLTFIHAKVRRHRWWKRAETGQPAVLKSGDPLVFSFGWRRFQSIPLYYSYDRLQGVEAKRRVLKYTPEHMHCHVMFYGPKTLLNTPFLCYQPNTNLGDRFRVCATGISVQHDNQQGSAAKVLKKLKLVGEPEKDSLKGSSCVLTSMFCSDIEAAKFIGARVQSVSGVRGVIKKAIGKSGRVRASFEHSLSVRDLVFLKTWTKASPEKFYNPICDVLYQSEGERSSLLMKTVGQLRYERQQKVVQNVDSLYAKKEEKSKLSKQRQIELEQGYLNRLNKQTVPKEVAQRLPFSQKVPAPQKKQEGENWKKNLDGKKRVQVLSKEEQKVQDLVNKLRAVRDEKERKAKEGKKANLEKKKRQAKPLEAKFELKKKEERKRKMRAMGQDEKYKKLKQKQRS